MKPRKVIITLEVETELPLDVLKNRTEWEAYCSPVGPGELSQIHVQVVQAPKAKKRKG